MEITRECLVVLFLTTSLIQRSYTQEFTSSPENVTVCDPDSIPTTFSLSCGYMTTSAIPLWNVTGLSMGQFATLSRGLSVDGYLSYPQPTAEEARLNIDLSSNMMEVVVGTCFQCVFDSLSGAIVSEKGCIADTGPPVCSIMTFAVAAITTNTISTNLTLACDRGMLMFEVYANSTMDSTPRTQQSTLLANVDSTIITVSGLLASTSYNLVLRLVNPQCANSTAATLQNVTTAAATIASSTPVSTTVSSSTTAPPPPTPLGSVPIGPIVGGTLGGLCVVALVVIIIIIAVLVVIKHKQKMKPDGVRLTRQPGEEMATLHEDATYANPDKEKAATEGADGVYSYAATQTVMGAKLAEPKEKGGKKHSEEKKAAEDVYTQPDKPKRGNKKQQPAPAPVPHKQGPAGELYAMPDKKAQTVGHVEGPQGDMYALSAKPPKGTYGAEGPH